VNFKEFYLIEDDISSKFEMIDPILMTLDSISEVVRYDWDKIAFGISIDEVIKLKLKDINIKYKGDLDNAIHKIDNENKFGKHFKDDFKNLPPIDVIFQNEKFYLDDGHHRYYYALTHNISVIDAKIVNINDNPIFKLGFNSIDDIIHRFKLIRNGVV